MDFQDGSQSCASCLSSKLVNPDSDKITSYGDFPIVVSSSPSSLRSWMIVCATARRLCGVSSGVSPHAMAPCRAGISPGTSSLHSLPVRGVGTPSDRYPWCPPILVFWRGNSLNCCSLDRIGQLAGQANQDDCKVDRAANPVSPEPVEGRVLRIR